MHASRTRIFLPEQECNYNPLQKRGLLFLTKRLPRKRNQNWRTFDNFQKVIIANPNDYFL